VECITLALLGSAAAIELQLVLLELGLQVLKWLFVW